MWMALPLKLVVGSLREICMWMPTPCAKVDPSRCHLAMCTVRMRGRAGMVGDVRAGTTRHTHPGVDTPHPADRSPHPADRSLRPFAASSTSLPLHLAMCTVRLRGRAGMVGDVRAGTTRHTHPGVDTPHPADRSLRPFASSTSLPLVHATRRAQCSAVHRHLSRSAG